MKSILYYIIETNKYNELKNLLDTLSIDKRRLNDNEENIIKKLYNLKRLSVSMELYKNDKYVMLDMIESNSKGAGTAFMNDFCAWGDKMDKILTLSPTDQFVGKRSYNRLVNFYKKFGFIENKGRRSDFKTHQKMLRIPN